MQKVQPRRELIREDFGAQSLALKALHELKEKDVPELARQIITGNAPASYRLSAAYYWALNEPEKAYPHLKLFLGQNGMQKTPAWFMPPVSILGAFLDGRTAIQALSCNGCQ